MGIPPQFLKHVKGKGKPDNAKEDAKDGGKDDAQETPSKGAPHKGGFKGPKPDSKDPKGSPFDAIPSGPMKGKNPNAFNKGGKSNAKRDAMLAQLRGGK